MAEGIGDQAAITFISSFYRAIGFGRSVQDAFEQGKIALMLEGIPQENVPVLLSRPEIDPSRIVFARPLSVEQAFYQPNWKISGIVQSQIKVKEVKLSVEVVDVKKFRADVLALKYAMNLYGADRAVALALGKTDDDVSSLVPTIGDSKLLDSRGAIASERVLFTNVGDLYHFGYDEIRSFASDTLNALARLVPTYCSAYCHDNTWCWLRTR